MRTIALALAALVASSAVALASCPAGTTYNCVQMPNGKMSCGCR